jgi:DNA processing protein
MKQSFGDVLSLSYASYVLPFMESRMRRRVYASLRHEKGELQTLSSAERSSVSLNDFSSKITLFLDDPLNHILTIKSPHYPSLLKETEDAPLVLYIRGLCPELLINTVSCSLVGSRVADPYGEYFASTWSREIASRGGTVVSGMALGIDGAAHRGALEQAIPNRLPTVAVLGSGLGHLYPRSHKNLAESIITQGGLLISQFAPFETPRPQYFLQRNRVIAGLSILTVVIQAAQRSGALSTARAANEYGRSVGTIPFHGLNSRFEGNLDLMKEGAIIFSKLEEILDALLLHSTNKNPVTISDAMWDKMTKRVHKHLSEVKVSHISRLSNLGISSDDLHKALLVLEIESLVERRDDGSLFYCG